MSNLGNKKIMAKNIKKYLELTGKTQKAVCNDLGLKESTFSDWLNGKVYPRIDKIELIANYFGVKKADLVEDDTYISPDSFTDAEIAHIKNYRQLTDDGKAEIDALIKVKLELQNQKSKDTQSAAG